MNEKNVHMQVCNNVQTRHNKENGYMTNNLESMLKSFMVWVPPQDAHVSPASSSSV